MHSRYAITIDGHPVATVAMSGHEIGSLWVDPGFRRQGYGRRIMKLVCDQGDREGVILKIMAVGEAGAMSTAQLEAWYARFGFQPRPNQVMDTMEREPRIRKAKGSPT